jgi:hypothetical protein
VDEQGGVSAQSSSAGIADHAARGAVQDTVHLPSKKRFKFPVALTSDLIILLNILF